MSDAPPWPATSARPKIGCGPPNARPGWPGSPPTTTWGSRGVTHRAAQVRSRRPGRARVLGTGVTTRSRCSRTPGDDDAGRSRRCCRSHRRCHDDAHRRSADAAGFADRVIGVSAGDRREQLIAARDTLITEAGKLTAASSGHVVAAGLHRPDRRRRRQFRRPTCWWWPRPPNPELVGSTAQGDRIMLSVSLLRTADGWRITGASPVKAGS